MRRIGAIAVLMCVGCAESSPPHNEVLIAAQGPLAIHRGEEGVGNSAMLVGTLLLEDGCLYVREEASESRGVREERRMLPVFPRTVRWDEERQTVVLGDTEAPIGALVTLAGGEFANSSVIEVAPETCDASRGFVANGMNLGVFP